MKKGVNIGRVVAKVLATVLALYVGGTVMSAFGSTVICTYSPFYDGLSLIGYTITDSSVVNATTTVCNTTAPLNGITAGTYNNLITSVSGTGVLAVIGILGIGAVVMEFVKFSW